MNKANVFNFVAIFKHSYDVKFPYGWLTYTYSFFTEANYNARKTLRFFVFEFQIVPMIA